MPQTLLARRQHLRSAGCHQLFVPQRSMFGRRVFSVAGPAACNSLPDYLRDPGPENFSFLVLLAYTAHWRHCDYALYNVNVNVNVNVAFNVTLHEQVR